MKLKVNVINQPERDEIEVVVFSKSFKAPKYTLWASLSALVFTLNYMFSFFMR
jgi:hypothetical protein